MPEFLTLMTPDEALSVILDQYKCQAIIEWVDLENACGRVTAQPVFAITPLPDFPRSTVDGYAVMAKETYGATESIPVYLRVIGEVQMGSKADFDLPPSHCALIHTGGMLPDNTDAIVMLEYTQAISSNEIEITRPVAPGENVIRIGEDVEAGQQVIPSGRILRPAEIGGLAALGISQVAVARKPRVAVLSTGDEVVPITTPLKPGQVHDVNAFSLSALINNHGGHAIRYGISPDRIDELMDIAHRAIRESDIVVITAGSSASTRDLTSQVINDLGKPGVIIHGLNIRPGKPTIIGLCSGKVVIGLPGNPVSALIIARRLLIPIMDQYLGHILKPPPASIRARLSINIPSQAGREDWIPVELAKTDHGFEANPVFGKSNLIFTLARADGLFCIPPDDTGLQAGTNLEVFLLY